MHEAKTTIDDTENDDRASEPSMDDTHDRLATSLVVMQVLVNSQCRLEKDQGSDDKVANHLVVGVELAHSLTKHNPKAQADNQKHQTDQLERGMNVADLLLVRQVQC